MLTVLNPESFDWENLSLQEAIDGNTMDVFYTLRLYHKFMDELDDNIVKLMTDLISPSLSVFAEMEYEGLPVIKEKMGDVSDELVALSKEKEELIREYPEVKEEHNLKSYPDQRKILFGEEGFDFKCPVLTDKDEEGTSKEVLELLKEQIEEELKRRG